MDSHRYPPTDLSTRWRPALIFVALFLCAQPLSAATETFSYSDGPLEGQGVAGEWTGAWAPGPVSAPPNGTTPWQVQTGQLEVNPVNPVAAFGFEQSDVQRDLTAPVTGTSVYMSYLITPGDLGAVFDPNLFTDGSNGVVAGFADTSGNLNTNGPMITTFRFQEGFTGLVTDGFAISLGGVFSSSNTNIGLWTQGQTYRMVGRLTFNAQGQKEQWSVWIDPVSESDAAAGSVTKDLGYAQIGMTRLYQYVDNFANVGSSMIDDIRIGDTWESVTAPLPSAIQGDLDSDGFVGVDDLNIVLVNWNQNVTPGDLLAGDPTGEGFVGVDDLNIVLVNWNNGTPPAQAVVPEPASACLLTCAALGLLGRARKNA